MTINDEIKASIENARAELHRSLDRTLDAVLQKLAGGENVSEQAVIFNDPGEEHFRDARNKNGHNLTPEGLEILFRLLDQGAGYNSAGRKMGITQTAVKNRKKDWEAAGGTGRTKSFVHYLDSDTAY